ncbi:hypothetical protein [Sphingomonas sp. UYP23]
MLRRFATFGQAVMELRWREAAVDLAIVVLGLLIGLQLNDWVDAAKRQREEHGYLLRLRDETRVNLATAVAIERSQRATVADLLRIARSEATTTAGALPLAKPDFGCSMLQLPAARVINTAYRELSEGAKLDILEDRPLRVTLGQAISRHDFTDSQIQYFRLSYQQYRQTLGRFYHFDIAADGTVACRIELAALLREARAMQVLKWLYRDQSVVLRYRQAETLMTRRVYDRLEALLRPGR